MSITFQIYPSNEKVPSVKDILDIADGELAKYLKGLGINKKYNILFGINKDGIYQRNTDNSILINNSNGYFYINVPEYDFKCYVTYRQHEKDYYWDVDGRGPLMGFIAGAIVKITDGIIDSGDGAWDINFLPINGPCFLETYAKLDLIKDSRFQRWWEENYVIDFIYKHDGELIYPKYQWYKVNRTPVKSRLKYIKINDNTLVVMESDLVQQLYFVCPLEMIKCDNEILYRLFEKFDWLAWSKHYYDFNPKFESGIDDKFEQEFLSQIVTIKSLNKMSFDDLWINENFSYDNMLLVIVNAYKI